jgi:hypothetical protein
VELEAEILQYAIAENAGACSLLHCFFMRADNMLDSMLG